MVPSVFILVLTLSEIATTSPLDANDTTKEEEERKADAVLVREIIDRKRSTLERGIKLAVILLCSRTLLDSPALDHRLSLLRRQSSLDTRASLFLISPVPIAEVANFVQSLKSELMGSSMDFYREHGRRVRRKRARLTGSMVSNGGKGRLGEKGWGVRYDFKLGLFAEMRGEVEVALKHYEDCYETLVEMFSSPALLAPRTKRWAEAKVLADCLTIKISKSYLYTNDSSRALAQFNSHLSRFRELSATWGIGEDTFEYWSWLSKQYRLFADLSVISAKAGFRLPSTLPPPTPIPNPTARSNQSTLQPGLIPPNVLQHSGYYFYMAGVCAAKRRDRFRVVKEALDPSLPLTPAIAHETKVEHVDIIVELFTQAYEYFKANKTPRMTLYIAAQIALAHFEAGNHTTALKFHERILRSQRRDKWRVPLDSIVKLSYESALALNDHESVLRYLFELISPYSDIEVGQREGYVAKLTDVLKTTSPSSPEKSVINLNMSEVAPLFCCQIAFWYPTRDLSCSVPFQLSISSHPLSRSPFVFSKLEIYFNDSRSPITIENALTLASDEKIQFSNCGSVEEVKSTQSRASLSWGTNVTKIFTGTVATQQELELTVSKVVLVLLEGDWTINLELAPDLQSVVVPNWHLQSDLSSKVALPQSNPSVCRIRPRQLSLEVQVSENDSAYLGEEFEVHVDIQNTDTVELDVSFDMILHPGPENSDNEILVDELNSSTILKAIHIGSLSPSTSIRKTFRLFASGMPGDRHVDISVHAHASLLDSAPDKPAPSLTNIFQSVIVPTVQPLFAHFDTHFHKKRRAPQSLLDMRDLGGWEGASDVTLVANLWAAGPVEIEVIGIELNLEKSPSTRQAQSSLDAFKQPFAFNWMPNDQFNVLYRLDVLPAHSASVEDLDELAYLDVTWRRREDTSQRSSRTTFLLPSFRSLPLEPTITLKLPPFIVLHEPTTLTYKLSNPTARLLSLSAQVDSAEGFVFAGPRKLPSLILAPYEERVLQVVVVPLVVGQAIIPRLQVFENNEQVNEQREEDLPEIIRELQVVEETDVEVIKDPKQIILENELRGARGESGEEEEVRSRDFVVLVLPRK